MKGIVLIINYYQTDSVPTWSAETQSWIHRVDQTPSTLHFKLRGRDAKEDDEVIFGLEQSFFHELFVPKENTFQNSIFDLTVEAHRFLSFPYFFTETKVKGSKVKVR